VVSTTLGAHGYTLASGHDCMLADSPTEFAAACTKLLDDHECGAAMADRAWRRFEAEWSWNAIAPRVIAAAEACLQRAR
jgi:glycosyltransferase involved in cell wall biosynthesis